MSVVQLQDLSQRGHLRFSDGYRTKRSELSQSGYRILRAADIKAGISPSGTDFVSAEYAASIGEKWARIGDVVVTTKGTVGRVAEVTSLDEDLVYSPQVCYFRVADHGPLRRHYLRYWFSSPEFWEQASYRMSSTDMAPYLSLRDVGTLAITLPTVHRQDAIAAILGALDDKIAANTRLTAISADLLRAHIQAACERESATATVDQMATFLNKRRIPLSSRQRHDMPGQVPYYGAAGQIDTVREAIFDESIVLVGEDGTVATPSGHAVVQQVWGPSWVNNHAHVLKGVTVSTELLGVLIGQADVRPLITGAVQPKLSMGKLKELVLHVPTGPPLVSLEGLTQDLFALKRLLAAESKTLAELRDTLLPALMSGRLQVKDAERQVEDAV